MHSIKSSRDHPSGLHRQTHGTGFTTLGGKISCVRLIFSLVIFADLLCGQPRRIVSTAPSITEMLFALGLGDSVVGVTDYCHYPPEAARKAKVGTFLNPNLEVIVSLKPDLVVTGPGQLTSANRAPALGLKVLEVRHDTVDTIYSAISEIGKAAGVPQNAAKLNGKIHDDLTRIRKRTAGLKPVTMMFIIGRTPGRLEGMVAVGSSSYLNELIRIAGGSNIFQDSMNGYPKISLEEILARNPEVIIDMGDMSDTVGVTEQQKRAVVQLWNQAPSLRAVKSYRVYAVASDVLVVPGPRVAEATRDLAHMLHPEAGL